MSKVWVNHDFHGFIGWRGQNVRLNGGDQFDTADDIVQDLPEMFTAKAPEGVEVEQSKRRGGRRG